jgi:pimeloyl-ACP methyl ester carboxylesterase
MQANKSTNGRKEISPALRAMAGRVSRLAPAFAGRLAERLFTTPRRHARSPLEDHRLKSATRSVVKHEGEELAVWQWGTGPAVLLVHGWEGRGAQLGGLVAPLTAAGFRVVTFDLPAHGASSGRTVTVAHMARAVARVADAVGPLAGIVAHSLGAAATSAALAQGVKPRRLVYIAPVRALESMVAGFEHMLGLGDDAARVFRDTLEAHAGAALSSLERMLAPRPDLPLLVVHDNDDREVPASEGERLVGQWRGALLHRTRGLGHVRVLADANIIDACVGFIADRPVVPLGQLIDRELFSRDARWQRTA